MQDGCNVISNYILIPVRDYTRPVAGTVRIFTPTSVIHVNSSPLSNQLATSLTETHLDGPGSDTESVCSSPSMDTGRFRSYRDSCSEFDLAKLQVCYIRSLLNSSLEAFDVSLTWEAYRADRGRKITRSTVYTSSRLSGAAYRSRVQVCPERLLLASSKPLRGRYTIPCAS